MSVEPRHKRVAEDLYDTHTHMRTQEKSSFAAPPQGLGGTGAVTIISAVRSAFHAEQTFAGLLKGTLAEGVGIA